MVRDCFRFNLKGILANLSLCLLFYQFQPLVELILSRTPSTNPMACSLLLEKTLWSAADLVMKRVRMGI